MGDRQMLLDMGFAPERVDWALYSTGNKGLQSALDHLEANQDKPMPQDYKAQPSSSTSNDYDAEDEAALADMLKKNGQQAADDMVNAVGEAKSIKCTDCGKMLKSAAFASYHAEKSGHTNFEESTEEIKPLTEEEKKARLEELKAKLAEKRAAQSKIDAEEAKANEKIRRKAGQDLTEVREEMKRKGGCFPRRARRLSHLTLVALTIPTPFSPLPFALSLSLSLSLSHTHTHTHISSSFSFHLSLAEMLKEAEAKKREKIADAQAKARIKAQIEADKRERAEKAANEKAKREGKPLVQSGSAQGISAAALASKPSASASNEARLRVKAPGGTWMGTLSADSTLQDVESKVREEGKDGGAPALKFSTTFPRKVFEASDMSKTLRELGLVPNAALEASGV
ncbi:hypothetical protein IE53DRAFT_75410 [Violaceomyces palustris]|uniref:Uncharacterized protein n=1 Tax=Violaceomyces palustris TaxID=1673888 RepID=A0ACD0NYP9_9BASI|nr:hypothetical protein IE53DRAFT_75410 [Violaceomyces palustris]